MTRKDYITLAEALRANYTNSANDAAERGAIMRVAHSIACALAADNPRFDREHFLAVVRGEKDLDSRPSRKPQDNEPIGRMIPHDSHYAVIGNCCVTPADAELTPVYYVNIGPLYSQHCLRCGKEIVHGASGVELFDGK